MTKDGVVRAAAQRRSGGVTRREFVQSSALVAGMGVWVATGGRVYGIEKSPNERINIACIGVGGKGDSDSDHCAQHGNVVAICDVDEKRLESKAIRTVEDRKTKEKVQPFIKAKKYTDFRKMFDEMGKEFDACTISTPDHTHAVATMMAIKAGKHVYTQKPLAHDVYEARQLRLAAKEHKVASQMGNQGTAGNKFREGVELIRAGVIGPVKEVHVWTNRPIWPQAPKVMARLASEQAPATMHWDEWLGTAPQRDYNKGYAPFNWRGWWDFGTGALGDMGCHTANLPFMALKLEHPISIEGECGDLNPETYPSWAKVDFQFAARGEMPPVKFTWYEGRKDNELVHPPKELTDKVMEEYKKLHPARADKKGKIKPVELSSSGSIIVGEKGMLYSPDDYGGSWDLLPVEAFRDYKAAAPTLPRNPGGGDEGQKIEWLAAARGGAPALANFDYAGLLAEFILLGNIAIKNPGRKLEFDGPGLKFPNYPDADRLLKREYRAPWTL
jgi:hypothetical protein